MQSNERDGELGYLARELQGVSDLAKMERRLEEREQHGGGIPVSRIVVFEGARFIRNTISTASRAAEADSPWDVLTFECTDAESDEEGDESEFGDRLWPAAEALGEFVHAHADSFSGKRVLELGSGRALPGIMAARAGADHVILSDAFFDKSRSTYMHCMATLRANGLPVEQHSLLKLDWSCLDDADHPLLEGLDVVLASDCFYDPRHFEPLVAMLAHLLKRNPRAVCIASHHLRSANRSLRPALRRWRLEAFTIDPLYCRFSECPSIPLRTPVELFAIAPIGTSVEEVTRRFPHALYRSTTLRSHPQHPVHP